MKDLKKRDAAYYAEKMGFTIEMADVLVDCWNRKLVGDNHKLPGRTNRRPTGRSCWESVCGGGHVALCVLVLGRKREFL